MDKEEQLIRQYLLGELDENGQAEIEQRYFSTGDNEAYQQILAIEDELHYDYSQGLLTAKERQRFEGRFLQAGEGRAKVRLAKTVLDGVAARAAREPSPSTERRSWWNWLAAPRISFAPMAAAAMVAVCGFLLFEVQRLNQRIGTMGSERQAAEAQLQQEYARQLEAERARGGAAPTPAEPKQPRPVLAFLLVPGLSRGGEGPKKLVITPGVDVVQLDLELQQAGFPRYLVELQTLDGDQLLSQSRTAAGKRLEFTVPAKVLRPGDYLIEVRGVDATGETAPAGDYYFSATVR